MSDNQKPEYELHGHTIQSWAALTESQRNTLRVERLGEIAKQRREQTRAEIERIKRESDERAALTAKQLNEAKRSRVETQLRAAYLARGGSPDTWDTIKDQQVDEFILREATAEVEHDRNTMRAAMKGLF